MCAVSRAKCSGGLCDVAGRAVCCPRNVDPPTVPAAPDPGDGRGSLFAPSAWLVLSTPVQKQIDLKLYGFYIGELEVPVAQVDLPIRMAKFLTVTPSYMGYSVPASGLNKLPPQPGASRTATRSTNFESTGPWRSPFASSRSPPATCMSDGFVQLQQTTRTAIAVELRSRIPSPFKAASGNRLPHTKPFMSSTGGWNRERIWTGVTLPLNKRVFVQPSYMWETSEGSRAVDYLLFGLIVNTR